MKQILTKVLLSAAICGASLSFVTFAQAQPTGTNIALNKKITVEPDSNYSYTRGHDPQLLTDGKYASTKDGKWNPDPKQRTGHLWTKKGSLTWSKKKPVMITIDLGEVQPISGLIYSTGGGTAGVMWPDNIYIATSNDKKIWYYAGDLVQLSAKNGAPSETEDSTFRYITENLQTHGRYISLSIIQERFIVTDEVQVLRGDDSLLHQSAGKEISDRNEFATRQVITANVQRRLNEDIATVRQEIEKSNLSAAQKSTFMARLDKDAEATADLEQLPLDFRAILPLNDTHRNILKIWGEVLASEGYKPLTIWKQQRYAWLPWLAKPNNRQNTSLNFSMLGNQFRSDALLLTNATDKDQQITVQLKGAPSNAQAGWIEISGAAWTGTKQGIPVAAALMPMRDKNGIYQIDVPAGTTRKIWLTVDSSKVPAGSHKSTFIVDGTEIPFAVDISKIAMQRPRFSLGMWDYTNGNRRRGITPQNRDAAIRLMQSHFVDSPWATKSALPWPKKSSFDTQNNLIEKLDFTEFDQWVSMWKDARHYLVFASVRSPFAGAEEGTAEFNAKVKSWAKALSAHMIELGLQPSQLCLMILDEPTSEKQANTIAAWAKPIKEAAPEITLYLTASFRQPSDVKNQDALQLMDILSPHFSIIKLGDASVGAFYQEQIKAGKKLWAYPNAGTSQLWSPQMYYRYLPWNLYSMNGTGEGFWAFGDISTAPTSFHGYYPVASNIYAPAFIDTDTVYDSLHWDAVREGIEDYEELAMLQDAIDSSDDAAQKAQAQKILNDAVAAITGIWTHQAKWSDPENPDIADGQLRNVRQMIEKLSSKT